MIAQVYIDGTLYLAVRCANCQQPVTVNPSKCPSLPVDGQRRAICRACFAEWNRIHRTSKGLDPVKLNPDAYAPEVDDG